LKTLSFKDIESLDKLYRTQLINCITGIKSVNLIATKNHAGQSNVAIFNSVIHLGSHPPLIGFIQRPNSVDRHTLENILETSYYTINAVTEEITIQAHQTSARYSRDENEFDETSIESEFLNDFYAPFVKDSPIKFGLHLEDVIPIPANNTKLIVGKVEQLHIDEGMLEADGHLALENFPIVGGVGLDTYVQTKKQNRYSYAKPDQPLKKL
jgi:flavin reductase (DIM6/NTAB) family NADH-FMN oxidoreductase RutF